MSKKEMQALARERVRILHSLSMGEKYDDPGLSRRHLSVMENIGKRMDITLPPEIKRSYCKRCKTPYASNTRLRLKRGGIVLVTCAHCGDTRRLPYRR